MKKRFKRIAAFVCTLAIAMSSAGVYAAKEKTEEKSEKKDLKLYEKYEYNENFEYNDVMIGHALKSSVVKILLHYEATMDYSPIILDEELLNEDLISLYNSYSDSYSKDEIIATFIENVQSNIANYISFERAKKVDVDGDYTGSGVVISEDGYIATNAHVATLTDDGKKSLYQLSLQEDVKNDISEVSDSAKELLGITLTNEQKDNLFQAVLDLSAEKTKIYEEDVSMYVCFPTAAGETSVESATIYATEVVAKGTQEGIDGHTQDVAILKIDAENLVALKLSDSYPETNSKITSAGFPVNSDVIFQTYGSEEATLSVTVGTGQVARLVPIDGSDYQAIEITTTISGGNSGGPSVDSNLNVEGLNTYGLNTDMRYAYMVPAEFIIEKSEDFDIGQEEVSKTFLLGLQMLQQDYGTTAVECFEKVKDLQPDTPYIENLIETAKAASENEAPAAGGTATSESEESATSGSEKSEKASGFAGYINKAKDFVKSLSMTTIIIIAGSAAAVVVTLIIVIVCVSRSKKKKKAKARGSVPPSTPMPGRPAPTAPPMHGAAPGRPAPTAPPMHGAAPGRPAPTAPPMHGGTAPTRPAPTAPPMHGVAPGRPTAPPAYRSSAPTAPVNPPSAVKPKTEGSKGLKMSSSFKSTSEAPKMDYTPSSAAAPKADAEPKKSKLIISGNLKKDE